MNLFQEDVGFGMATYRSGFSYGSENLPSKKERPRNGEEATLQL